MNWAGWNAGGAVYALHRVYVEHVIADMKAIHRTSGHALCEATGLAIVSNYMRHAGVYLAGQTA